MKLVFGASAWCWCGVLGAGTIDRMGTALAVLVLGAAVPAFGQTPAPPPPTLTISRVDAPTKIEDYLDGGQFPGTKVTGFKQREPKDLEPATEETTAYLAYDQTTLYAAFVCRASNPAQVHAHMDDASLRRWTASATVRSALRSNSSSAPSEQSAAMRVRIPFVRIKASAFVTSAGHDDES